MFKKALKIFSIVLTLLFYLIINGQVKAFASNWSTDGVILEFSKLEITVDGKKFKGSDEIFVHSDVGNSDLTTIEATWIENEVEMRLYFYFTSVNDKWSIKEIRSYNGQSEGEWLYYPGLYGGDLGSAYLIETLNLTSTNGEGKLSLNNLRILPLFSTNEYKNQLIGPIEGEKYSIGTVLPINWKLSGIGSADNNQPFKTVIYLTNENSSSELEDIIMIAKNQNLTKIGENNFSWSIENIPEGNYKLNIKVFLKYSGSDASEILFAQSDKYFSVTPRVAQPTITIVATPAAQITSSLNKATTSSSSVSEKQTITTIPTESQENITPTSEVEDISNLNSIDESVVVATTQINNKTPNIFQRLLTWFLSIFKSE